jgi:hypothetical protein
MRTVICILGVLALGSAVMAETADSTVEPAAVDTVLEEKDVLRDPFWPVGYAPAPPEPEVPEEEEKEETEEDLPPVEPEKWPVLKIRGLSKDGKGNHLAILDKIGIVEEGDIVSFKHDNLVYRWQVKKITDKGVSQERLGVQRADETKKTKTDKSSLPADLGGIK